MTDTITAADMGRMVGVTARQVRSLADRGHMIRQGDDRYDPAASLLAYCAFLRAAAQGRGGESAAAAAEDRARLSRARAELTETKAAVARRDLVSASEVQSTWSGIVRSVRAAVLALPTRAAARIPHLTAADIRELDAEARAVLTELANSDG